jgi:broad specificity phosphatase PhoE
MAAIVSSPLQRALETAEPLAANNSTRVVADIRLTEFGLANRWAGIAWSDLPRAFPGELEAYLSHPLDLPFSAESVFELAGRVSSAIRELVDAHSGSEVAVVSHQDPLQAALIALTGGDLADLRSEPPRHAEIITLSPGVEWRVAARWHPE